MFSYMTYKMILQKDDIILVQRSLYLVTVQDMLEVAIFCSYVQCRTWSSGSRKLSTRTIVQRNSCNKPKREYGNRAGKQA